MISGKNYRKNSKNSRKFGYSLITVNFTVVFPEKFYPCMLMKLTFNHQLIDFSFIIEGMKIGRLIGN